MITILLGMFIWAALHSFTAGRVKPIVRQRFGERAYHGGYRFGYNVFATVTIAPILWLVYEHRTVIWAIPSQWIPVSVTVQVVGVVGLIAAMIQIDLGRFSGLSQLRAYLAGEPLPLPPESLQVRGLYGLVRHPLYLFSLLAIWPFPVMTEGLLAFNIAATLYFLIGSRLEERRLAAAFGQAYTEYRRRVPWLIPLPSFWRRAANQTLR